MPLKRAASRNLQHHTKLGVRSKHQDFIDMPVYGFFRPVLGCMYQLGYRPLFSVYHKFECFSTLYEEYAEF